MSLFSKGTVFSMDSVAIRNTFILLFLAAIITVVTLVGNAAALGDLQALSRTEFNEVKDMTKSSNKLVPFILEFFVLTMLSRWWDLRVTALGLFFDSLANVCMLCASELHGGKWREVRECITKYSIASVELLVQAARQDEDIANLVEKDLLTDVEGEFLEEHRNLWQRPMVVLVWTMHVATDAMDLAMTPCYSRLEVIQQCLQARDGLANINMYLDTQLPFAYVHFVTLIVNAQNIMIAVRSGLLFAKAVPTLDIFVMVQQIVCTPTIVFFYQSLLAITYMIMDPFGDDVLDFPIMAYKAYFASCVDAVMGAGRACPAVRSDGKLARIARLTGSSPTKA